MSIVYDSTTIKTLLYGSTDILTAAYDATQVFVKNAAKTITEYVTAHTEDSVVPPPYDDDGYNHNSDAPTEEAAITINMGDITGFDRLTFTWDNEGSGDAYGYIAAYYNWNEEKHYIFNDTLHASGSEVVELYSGCPTSLTITLVARSDSAYSGYRSHTTLNLYNVRLIKN